MSAVALAHRPTIVLEAKLGPPPQPAGLVARPRLLRRLEDPEPSVVVLRAPAGYGKTTALAQFASATDRRLAWVSLDASDDDPELLLLELAIALARAGPLDAQVLTALHGPEPDIERVVLPGLLNGLGAGAGTALVLDGLNLVESPESLAAIAFICEHVPAAAQVLIATRAAPSLWPGRLRARGGLLELGPHDLALRRGEVEALIRAAGAAAGDGSADAVLERTEGWPTGVWLAVRSLPRAGDDPDLTDDVVGELLDGLSPGLADFLLRTSILDRFSAPLCDEVLGRDDSAWTIAGLEDADLFVVPLDRGRRWYRHHALFRDVLREELGRREPGAAELLHRRAAEWHQRNGAPEDAVRHALAGRDMDRAAELVVRNAQGLLDSGRHATARGWLDAFSDEDVLRSGSLALTGACLTGLSGEKERARRYIALAARASWTGPGAMGEASRESGLALMTALFADDGVTRMRAHAATAHGLEPVGSPAHEAAALALGCSLALLGRTAEAVPLLEEAAALGADRAVVSLVALAMLSQTSLDAGRLDDAADDVRRGRELCRRAGLDEGIGSAALASTAAELSVRSGDGRAREHLERGLRLLVRGAPFPWCSIQTRITLGRVALGTGDPALAETLLAQARQELVRCPDAGILPRRLARAEHALEEARGGAGVLSDHITNAERRVLDLLPTHLTLEAIAEMLHISKSTVKSHLGAIYRKLGVSGRSDAVAAARRHGILTPGV